MIDATTRGSCVGSLRPAGRQLQDGYVNASTANKSLGARSGEWRPHTQALSSREWNNCSQESTFLSRSRILA